ncbi:unnamed protein product [Lampetra fluviatilis]
MALHNPYTHSPQRRCLHSRSAALNFSWEQCGLVPWGASVSPGSAVGLGSPWPGQSSSSEAWATSGSEDEALGVRPRRPRRRHRLYSHLLAEEKLLR